MPRKVFGCPATRVSLLLYMASSLLLASLGASVNSASPTAEGKPAKNAAADAGFKPVELPDPGIPGFVFPEKEDVIV